MSSDAPSYPDARDIALRVGTRIASRGTGSFRIELDVGIRPQPPCRRYPSDPGFDAFGLSTQRTVDLRTAQQHERDVGEFIGVEELRTPSRRTSWLQFAIGRAQLDPARRQLLAERQ